MKRLLGVALVGGYIAGCLLIGPVAIFLALLGGKTEDVLTAVMFTLAWPISVPFILLAS